MGSKAKNASVKEDQDKLWRMELQVALAAARSENCDFKTVAITYYKSILQFNLLLHLLATAGRLHEQKRSNEIIDKIIRRMRPIFPEIIAVDELLPKSIFAEDHVISYADHHSRSWAGIILDQLRGLLAITSMPSGISVSNREAVQVIDIRGFDSEFVKVNLQIEFERIHARLSTKKASSALKRRGPQPDPEKDRIEEMYRKCMKKADYYAIAESLNLQKWNGRTPYKRVECVVNAMHQRDRRSKKRK